MSAACENGCGSVDQIGGVVVLSSGQGGGGVRCLVFLSRGFAVHGDVVVVSGAEDGGQGDGMADAGPGCVMMGPGRAIPWPGSAGSGAPGPDAEARGSPPGEAGPCEEGPGLLEPADERVIGEDS